jgi:hypothetical protein
MARKPTTSDTQVTPITLTEQDRQKLSTAGMSAFGLRQTREGWQIEIETTALIGTNSLTKARRKYVLRIDIARAIRFAAAFNAVFDAHTGENDKWHKISDEIADS